MGWVGSWGDLGKLGGWSGDNIATRDGLGGEGLQQEDGEKESEKGMIFVAVVLLKFKFKNLNTSVVSK